MTLSRRNFLEGAAVASLWSLAPAPLAWAAPSGARGNGRTLVVIQLAGGNDGLNTVAPYADPLYRKLRPSLALNPDELLKLDDRLALNSALHGLHEHFLQGRLAIIQGLGYPTQNRSHFESTATWQTARLDPHREGTGWLGRALEAGGDAAGGPLAALGIGGAGLTPVLASAREPHTALSSLEAFAVQPDRRFPGDAPALNAALASLYEEAPGAPAMAGFIRQVGRSALRSSGALGAAVRGYSSKVDYPKGPFGDQLRLVAQLLAADLGVRAFHVTLGGFDTHANQKRLHAAVLGQLSDGLSALLEDAGAHGFAERLAVMTYSEFGRRAEENGSAGTDHGSGSVAFVVGAKVAGGLQGPAPDLSKLDGGDVPRAVDFRALYAAVLREWLELPPDKLLGGGFPGLKLFKA